ncbi:MAG: ribonuclease III [Rhodobacteraceae bacterium]|nr:ribonuclease III [Paracoccaceae bacterium]
MDRSARIDALERRIGYTFTNRNLLAEALTHNSVDDGAVSNFQRLEFLGDRVLGLCIASELMSRYPEDGVGDLAKRFMVLVSGKTCAEIARKIELGTALQMQAGSKGNTLRSSESVLADAMEVLIAALYIDGGLEAARGIVLDAWDGWLDRSLDEMQNAKSQLQEHLLAVGKPLPVYQVVERVGPDHDPLFTVEVSISGERSARARAGTKQDAEKKAAASILQQIGA